MTERARLPEIRREALRNVASVARIERVWSRLEGDLQRRPRSATVPGVHLPRWAVFASAAGFVLFALGVFGGGAYVGARYGVVDAPPVTVAFEPSGVGDRGTAPLVTASPSADGARATPRPTRQRHKAIRSPAPDAPPNVQPNGVLLPVPVPPVQPTATTPEWYSLWEEGEYLRAQETIERLGGFDAVLDRATAEQAMAMVDIARSVRQNALAIAALRSVVERYPSDPYAPYAALTLGNLLDRAGDAKGAQAAFSTYRALSPDGDFAEDALARQIEAALGEGNVALARELLAQYEKHYPLGTRLGELRTVVGTAVPSAESTADGAHGDGAHAVDPGSSAVRAESVACPPVGSPSTP